MLAPEVNEYIEKLRKLLRRGDLKGNLNVIKVMEDVKVGAELQHQHDLQVIEKQIAWLESERLQREEGSYQRQHINSMLIALLELKKALGSE